MAMSLRAHVLLIRPLELNRGEMRADSRESGMENAPNLPPHYNRRVRRASTKAVLGTLFVAGAACVALSFSIGQQPVPPQVAAGVEALDGPADRPAPRTDQNSSIAPHRRTIESPTK